MERGGDIVRDAGSHRDGYHQPEQERRLNHQLTASRQWGTIE